MARKWHANSVVVKNIDFKPGLESQARTTVTMNGPLLQCIQILVETMQLRILFERSIYPLSREINKAF